MYNDNYLAKRLRSASIGRDETPFLKVFSTGATITYGTFFANAEKMASLLCSLGVQPGDRVAIQSPKTPAALEFYVGVILAGAVFLPLNPAYTSGEVAYFLGDTAPKVFICDPDSLEHLFPVALECGVPHVLTLGENDTGSLIAMRDMQQSGFGAVARDGQDLAAILYTSGTTGKSKGAMLSHFALASNSLTLVDFWRFDSNDTLIHALPIFHTHGLFVATNVTLMAAGSCIFMTGFDAGDICRAMPNATALMGVPTFYVRLLDQPDLAESAKNMRLFVSGSAPLLAETHENWRTVTGHAVLERYGMTETNMNTSNPYIGERRAGSVGFALPEVNVIITDPTSGTLLPKGEIGTIEVRGPNLFSGYWNLPEKTAAEFRENGFFITGDLGRFDDDGYLNIVGRSKDLIISGGFNIYPKEVEQEIDLIDQVIESAVIGVPHKDLGEAVIALVVISDNCKLGTDDILRTLDTKLARYKQPKAVIFVNELGRNSMGKVQKNEMRLQYSELFSGSG